MPLLGGKRVGDARLGQAGGGRAAAEHRLAGGVQGEADEILVGPSASRALRGDFLHLNDGVVVPAGA